MRSEVVPLWQSTPPKAQTSKRDRSRQIGEVGFQTNLARHQVSGISNVAKGALLEMADLSVLRRAAEQLCPEIEDLTAMITVAAAIKMTEVITDLDRRW